MEAALFVRLTCARTGLPNVGRFERVGASYKLTAASRQRPQSAAPGGSDDFGRTQVDVADEYAGCPRCGARAFVQCGSCRELACWNAAETYFTCPTCANGGIVRSGTIAVDGMRRI